MGKLEKDFIENGYVITSAENLNILDTIHEKIADVLHGKLKKSPDLKQLHQHVPIAEINSLRLAIYQSLNSIPNFVHEYHLLAQNTLNKLVGNELAGQNKINLSIQMPGDTSSRLGLHTDTLSGESEFEVILWTPLTEARSTNAMFMFSKQNSKEMLKALPEYSKVGMDKLFEDYRSKLQWMEVDPGQVIIFSSTLMHGNVVNETSCTRFSLNARFKALFSPYSTVEGNEKKLANFYQPMNLLPVTQLALEYDEPSNF